MPKIKFTRDVTTKEAKPQTFAKDQVVDFPDDAAGQASARHWLNRGAAVEVPEEEGRKATPKAAEHAPHAGGRAGAQAEHASPVTPPPKGK